MLNPASLVF